MPFDMNDSHHSESVHNDQTAYKSAANDIDKQMQIIDTALKRHESRLKAKDGFGFPLSTDKYHLVRNTLSSDDLPAHSVELDLKNTRLDKTHSVRQVETKVLDRIQANKKLLLHIWQLGESMSAKSKDVKASLKRLNVSERTQTKLFHDFEYTKTQNPTINECRMQWQQHNDHITDKEGDGDLGRVAHFSKCSNSISSVENRLETRFDAGPSWCLVNAVISPDSVSAAEQQFRNKLISPTDAAEYNQQQDVNSFGVSRTSTPARPQSND